MNEIVSCNNLPIAVEISGYSVYISTFKISELCQISEKSTLSGKNVFTLNCPRNTTISLSGEMISNEFFSEFVVALDSSLKNKTAQIISYKGLSYETCILKSYLLEENENGVVKVKFVFLSNSSPEEAQENGDT